METQRHIFRTKEDGTYELVKTETIVLPEVPEVDTTELIKNKEEELLKMYQELEALKSQNQ